MDNILQLEEIHKYQRQLADLFGTEIDEEIAALLWVHKYAESWRLIHAKREMQR